MAGPSVSEIAYCGLNCNEFFAYKMTVSEAAKSLRREIRAARLKETWTDALFVGKYEQFKKSLDGLAMLRRTKECDTDWGNP